MGDQVFVQLKQAIVGLAPAFVQPWLSLLISAGAIIGTFAGLFALTTLLERKGLGRMQNRRGPNRVGPAGLFQPIADGLKMLTKEDIVPRGADPVVHLLAPIVMVMSVLLAYAVLPVGRNMVGMDLEAGLVFFFAVGAGTELAVFMAGWASRNKYSLLGAMRGLAQMISYEVPLILSALAVVLATGSLSLVRIADGQAAADGALLARWHVFTPWGFAGFLLFLFAATAEANRAPFDIPEGESEIIAGHMVEYSGFKYALFFLAEYLGLFAASALEITLFLGAYHAPVSFLPWVPTWAWFFLKLLALIAFFIWVRGTLPRLRPDQLMRFAWKFLLPMTLINLVVAGLWTLAGREGTTAALVWRWPVALAILVGSYALLVRRLRAPVQLRKYRFAEL